MHQPGLATLILLDVLRNTRKEPKENASEKIPKFMPSRTSISLPPFTASLFLSSKFN
jgi:hypothetical protein